MSAVCAAKSELCFCVLNFEIWSFVRHPIGFFSHHACSPRGRIFDRLSLLHFAFLSRSGKCLKGQESTTRAKWCTYEYCGSKEGRTFFAFSSWLRSPFQREKFSRRWLNPRFNVYLLEHTKIVGRIICSKYHRLSLGALSEIVKFARLSKREQILG